MISTLYLIMMGILRLVLLIGVLVVPLFVTGPVAVIAYSKVINKNNYQNIFLFWLLLLVADILSSLLIIIFWGHSWPGPGFYVVLKMPISVFIALLISLWLGKQLWQTFASNRNRQIMYVVGVMAILSLQLLVSEFSPLYWSPVCGWLYLIGISC